MSLDAYYDRIGDHHLAALWTRLSHLITPQPRSDCRAHRWRYTDVRPELLAAGEEIGRAHV